MKNTGVLVQFEKSYMAKTSLGENFKTYVEEINNKEDRESYVLQFKDLQYMAAQEMEYPLSMSQIPWTPDKDGMVRVTINHKDACLVFLSLVTAMAQSGDEVAIKIKESTHNILDKHRNKNDH